MTRHLAGCNLDPSYLLPISYLQFTNIRDIQLVRCEMILENVVFMNSVDKDIHRECMDQVLTTIRRGFEGFEFPSLPDGAPSLGIRRQFENSAEGASWLRKQSVRHEVPRSLGRTGFEVDFLKIFRETPCGQAHPAVMELAFDNRQAIGTNLLKLEVAAAGAQNTSQIGFGILVCPGDNILKVRGWDGAVGASSEYESAIRDGYSGILKSSKALLVVR